MRNVLKAAAAVGISAMTFGILQASGTAGAQARGRLSVSQAVAHGYRLRIANTMVGPLLVSEHGYTVFIFSRDRRDDDVCAQIKGCLEQWPAVTTAERPIAGPGVKRSLMGSIPYHGKLRQVTYAGHPLHTYKFDYGRGSMMNIGNKQFGGSWYALNAAAKPIR
jgi:predicted lipoprotein with Yx(FWY)xxD motif